MARRGIVRLRLEPDGVLAHAGLQLGLWGDVGAERDRAHRALVRVQGMLGRTRSSPRCSAAAAIRRRPVQLVPWGDERLPARPAEPPWPGRLPAPSPATVLTEPDAGRGPRRRRAVRCGSPRGWR